MQYGMMIELDKCVGCQACVTSCKQRWDTGPGAARDWVFQYEQGTRESGLGLTFYPGLCMHCEDHPCTTDCPSGATYADENGVVVVDRDVCIGCGNCISMCPYGARHADSEQGIVEKCNFCAPYVARGDPPACVSTCLAGCRTFGDLDDPKSDLVQLIKRRGAKPLTTPEVQVGPKVHYAPEPQRRHIVESGVIRRPTNSWLTRAWQGTTRPAAQYAVPAVAAAAVLGGLIADFRSRGARAPAPGGREETKPDTAGAPRRRTETKPDTADAPRRREETEPRYVKRHSLGMRVLHWFNAVSWVGLLLTGTAIMATDAFALFGTRLPTLLAAGVGGRSNLLLLHVLWGLAWAAAIVPGFLYNKRGGIDAIREVWLTRDDVRWLKSKPLAMLGIGDAKLPPQDKYNAGQKLFAISVLVATALIIASGLTMAFHLGPAGVVAAAILVHKLAIMLALLGLGVHLTMAVILREERPALRGMVRGDIELEHAATHAEKWAKKVSSRSEVQDS